MSISFLSRSPPRVPCPRAKCSASGRLVALICDDRLFVKPTEAGREFLGEVEAVLPYPQAKPWYLVAEEKWDEREWLSRLIAITTAQLPLPPPKPPKKKKTAPKKSTSR